MDAHARHGLPRWGTFSMPPGTFVYEIYPRSFQATGGSTGTIAGICERLDHLAHLGVKIIWLTPIFPSPMDDFGYDVSEYCDIDPLFGSLADLDLLVTSAAERGIEIMLDLVANHTSSRHAWFVESRSSRTNPKRDWYIWRDPSPNGGPPNNWLAVFGGSAWQFDDATGQYYLHSFLPTQPDLNWENPEVQQAIKDILHFWAARGIRFWRVDALDWTGKDFQYFRDNPPNPNFTPGSDPYNSQLHHYSRRMPNHFSYLRILGDVLREYDGFMVVETYPPGIDVAAEYRHVLDNYPTDVAAPLLLTALIYKPFTAISLAVVVHEILAMIRPGETPVWITGTHDVSRVASRLPNAEAARLMLMLLMLLPGARVMYYGEEIGMSDGVIPRDRVQDPFELRVPGRGLGRDPNRTPMQWSAETNAGFSTCEPWLPIGRDYATCNVASQRHDPHSMLTLAVALSRLASRGAFINGAYEPLDVSAPLFGFLRQTNDTRYLVILNTASSAVQYSVRGESNFGALCISSGLDRPEGTLIDLTCIELRPWEGCVIKL